MHSGFVVFMVAVLSHHTLAQPGTIADETLTFVYPYRSDIVNYLEHDLFAAGVHVHNMQHVVFSAKGKNNAHVLLKKDRNSYVDNVVEIAIGCWANTGSIIRDTLIPGQPANATFESYGIISESEFRTFWASWSGNCIKVGRGYEVGQDVIMTWCGPTHGINYISAGFGWRSGGTIKFLKTATQLTYYSEYSERDVDYPKHDFHSDGVDVMPGTSVVFTTKGRNDAHVLLRRDRNDYVNHVIEVVLGGWGNKKSVIREKQQGPYKAFHDETGIVSPTEDRHFWMSWENSCIKVGKGYSVGKSEFLIWCGLTHEINYVSGSYGFGSDGFFTFTRTAGAPVYTCTSVFWKD